MNRPCRLITCLVAVVVAGNALTRAESPSAAGGKPTIEQFLKPGFPYELVSADKADRVAWLSYEAGKRNVFTAAAPDFRATRVTSFTKDDGVDLTGLEISADGRTFVFVRGTAPNNVGWNANPTSDPNGAERAIWGARVGAPAFRLAEGTNPVLSPDGSVVLYVKGGQIYRAKVAPMPPMLGVTAAQKMDTGEKPFITAWGTNGAPQWSPDGTKIAFTSNRTDHAFIGLYDMKTRTVSFIEPGVDRDTNPTWSRDSKHIAFIRRPGTPFGLQSQQGIGGVGNPAGPAAAGRAGATGRQGAAGGGRGGRGGDPAPPQGAALASQPGLYRATFVGGHTMEVRVFDVAAGTSKLIWKNAPDERVYTAPMNIRWAGDALIFPFNPAGDEFERYYSIRLDGTSTAPVQITTTSGLIEDAANTALSKDGKTFYYSTNAEDIDRRHIWSVPTTGGTPQRVTMGDEIENTPVTLASGKQIAVLSAAAVRPQSVGIWPAAAATPLEKEKVVYPTLAADFPTKESTVPTNVTLKAEDGVEFHNQLFLPKDMKPGVKYPALIFVHGGPQRQMLLGYHYLSFYHVFYAVNQWLTTQGYIVMSVNYRSGVGYGRSFQRAANTGARGNAEYRDVLAAGKYLAAMPEVDPARVGIWGLSYGGLLTAEALARNSDIFKAGVDLAGVHLEGSSLNPDDVSYKASAISNIDNWKSPVLLEQGDDDRNVNFSQTVGLVQLLRARNIYHELIVFPDDVHETLLHSRWLYFFGRMETFLHKFLPVNQ
jgi:dipeptidyl aminopeptidase/acylaminoacyl peptidase